MRLAKVSLQEDEHDTWLEVAGVGRIPAEYDTGDDFIGPEEVVRHASLTSLRRALIRRYGIHAPPPVALTVDDPATGEPRVVHLPSQSSIERGAVLVVDVQAEKFAGYHTYEFLPEPIALALFEGGRLTVRISLAIEGEDEPERALLSDVLEPLLRATGSSVVHIENDPEGPVTYRASTQVHHPDFWGVRVYIAVPTHGRTAASAFSIGRDALALLEAAAGGALSRLTAEALVASGRPHLLIGQPESSWLECTLCRRRHNVHYADLCVMPTTRFAADIFPAQTGLDVENARHNRGPDRRRLALHLHRRIRARIEDAPALSRTGTDFSNEIARVNVPDRGESGSSGGQDYADLYAATTACPVGSLGQVGITRRSA